MLSNSTCEISFEVLGSSPNLLKIHRELLLFHSSVYVNFYRFFVLFCFLFFLGLHPQHTEVPRLGVESKLQLWLRPQPQQHGIQVASVTYTTVHGNAGSLTHLARPGIKPTSSWILVRFISTAPHWELPREFFKIQ